MVHYQKPAVSTSLHLEQSISLTVSDPTLKPTLITLSGSKPMCSVDHVSIVGKLAAGELGITVDQALEAALHVESFVHFIRRGLLHIKQERRVVYHGEA